MSSSQALERNWLTKSAILIIITISAWPTQCMLPSPHAAMPARPPLILTFSCYRQEKSSRICLGETDRVSLQSPCENKGGRGQSWFGGTRLLIIASRHSFSFLSRCGDWGQVSLLESLKTEK